MARELSHIPDNPADLDQFFLERESALDLKPGTEARIEWNEESKFKKTEYAIVYLHGFRASHPEGYPVHQTVAKHFGYNLFLSRLEEHGVDSEYPLLHLTEEKLLDSARFALEIGKKIGKKVILMGTSTGASLALWLSSQNIFKDKISALLLYSPLVRFYGINQQLLMNSFTRSFLRFVLGKKYLIRARGTSEAEDRIWHNTYTLQAALVLGAFVEHHMKKETFASVECPVFTGYYFKNKREQDNVVSVPAIKKMISSLGSYPDLVTSFNFPNADSHVICSSLLSRSVDDVIDNTKNFLKNVGSHRAREKS